MALNIGSTTINNVYRGSTTLSAIYVGVNLVWPITPISQTNWYTKGLSLVLNENSEQKWITKGLSLKFII